MNFDASYWLAYREANIRFADVVSSFVRTGDVIWVQDYHLMLLPMLLRSMISGESAQGEMTRREMGRVKEGVDEKLVPTGMVRGLDEGVEMLEDVEEEGPEGGVATSSPRGSVSAAMSAFQKQEIRARQRGKGGIRIGFFLHTPFPSSEIYRYVEPDMFDRSRC
jgi:trehalose 6-phosphate synthase